MIKRYEDPLIASLWTDEAKLLRWQDVELAVLSTKEKLGKIPAGTHQRIKNILENYPPDTEWWLQKDEEIGQDLIAFIEERTRHLPKELQCYFHQDMTSADTQESAFILALIFSSNVTLTSVQKISSALTKLAHKYRSTPFLEKTHGKGAKLRSFGGRALIWLKELRIAEKNLRNSLIFSCGYSKLSGAIGNYGGRLSPEIEKETLAILGFKPFYGATQIIPRVLYAPLAQSLELLALVLEKIAHDIRLGSRGAYPILSEPFGKRQKGSSAMPHKRNPVLCEQMEGMVRIIHGLVAGIVRGIHTSEARSIEQSSVERIAWPDLFHSIMRMTTVMTKILEGLNVYPDNMLREIVESRGTYASDEAKNFLGELCGRHNIEFESAYRIIQLASFCVFTPEGFRKIARTLIPHDHFWADRLLSDMREAPPKTIETIQEIIKNGRLFLVDELDIDQMTVDHWNNMLKDFFKDPEICAQWDDLFKIWYLLKHEEFIFNEILDQ